MPDVRSLWRALSPQFALHNARREVIEHARISAEVDAVIRRVTARDEQPGPERSVESLTTTDSSETLETSGRAS